MFRYKHASNKKIIQLVFLGIGLASISTQGYDVETTKKHNEHKDLEKRTGSTSLGDSPADNNDLDGDKNVEEFVPAKKSKHASVKSKSKHHRSKSGSKRHKNKGRFTSLFTFFVI